MLYHYDDSGRFENLKKNILIILIVIGGFLLSGLLIVLAFLALSLI